MFHCGYEDWITAASATPFSLPRASDRLIILGNTVLCAAKNRFDKCGKVILVPRQKVFENNAEDVDGCSEDDDVRGEGHDWY